MKNLIICEGKKDLILFSYYLSKMHGWESINLKSNKDWKSAHLVDLNKFDCSLDEQQLEWYRHEENILGIYAIGSNDRIPDGINQVLTINKYTNNLPIDKLVIITDRDDDFIETNIIKNITDLFGQYDFTINEDLKNKTWHKTTYTKDGEDKFLDILMLVIPFEETGTIEDFLLDCLSNKSDDEKILVDMCIDFVNSASNIEYIRKKYLDSRGMIPKAKFSSYFSITSPNRTFDAGDKILRSIPWEDYTLIQESFKLLEEL